MYQLSSILLEWNSLCFYGFCINLSFTLDLDPDIELFGELRLLTIVISTPAITRAPTSIHKLTHPHRPPQNLRNSSAFQFRYTCLLHNTCLPSSSDSMRKWRKYKRELFGLSSCNALGFPFYTPTMTVNCNRNHDKQWRLAFSFCSTKYWFFFLDFFSVFTSSSGFSVE